MTCKPAWGDFAPFACHGHEGSGKAEKALYAEETGISELLRLCQKSFLRIESERNMYSAAFGIPESEKPRCNCLFDLDFWKLLNIAI